MKHLGNMSNQSVLDKDSAFYKGLEKLGFETELNDCLFLTDSTTIISDPELKFHIEKAKEFGVTAVFFRKQLGGNYKAQVYLYDYTGQEFQANKLTKIQKKIWSSGEVPLVCIFYDTEVKILDCTNHIKDDDTPIYLIEKLQFTGHIHKLYNQEFAVKIKSGIFWEEQELKNKFSFQNSAYDVLIRNIRKTKEGLSTDLKGVDKTIISKLIIQSILIKYLEERVDANGGKLFSDKYFAKFDGAEFFTDVLRKPGECVKLFEDLEKDFNGNIFSWTHDEKNIIQGLNLKTLADDLDANHNEKGQMSFWRYYEFSYVPVELISRLYEEFLGEGRRNKGLYYTPSHLAKLLVDEAMPLKKYKDVDINNYKVLDPACGSGIFLVIAFKRLVQWWRLKNQMEHPDLATLKGLLKNVYGVDQEKQAIRLASFSLCLALCDELKPLDIINNLKFDDLSKTNLIESDFFHEDKLVKSTFDLVIGNPPFNRGAVTNYSQYWEYNREKVKIPQGQIALKFLSESIPYLKEKGLLCLIIKASGLLYNSTSKNYKDILFSNLNVIQVLDFTALARNKSLWDNGADVASAAIFLRNEKPDYNQKILHLTFRRTKATIERIIFEIDDYDLHFINRQTAIENDFIWKTNLLGGGRINNTISKLKNFENFEVFLSKNACIAGEGYIIGSNGKLKPNHIFQIPSLSTESINETGINYSELQPIDKNLTFVKVPDQLIFTAPNVIIWENIGEKKLPVFYNEVSFSFKHKIVGVASKQNDSQLLKQITNSFDTYSDLYRFYIYATSSQVLINKNTAILKTDIMQIPFMDVEKNIQISDTDKNIISDVNNYMQLFLRNGENSKAVQSIANSELRSFIINYGNEFSKVLNLIYEDKNKKFRLSDVISLYNNSYIATVFKYDTKEDKPEFHQDNSKLDLDYLSTHRISESLSANRIIKLYPEKDTIVFIKPNQYRYWLSLIAYRDADKCFADLSRQED